MGKKVRCKRCGSTKVDVNVDSLVTTYHCRHCGDISTIEVDKELEKMYKKDKKNFINGK